MNRRSTPAGAKVNGSQNRVTKRDFVALSMTRLVMYFFNLSFLKRQKMIFIALFCIKCKTPTVGCLLSFGRFLYFEYLGAVINDGRSMGNKYQCLANLALGETL